MPAIHLCAALDKRTPFAGLESRSSIPSKSGAATLAGAATWHPLNFEDRSRAGSFRSMEVDVRVYSGIAVAGPFIPPIRVS